MLGHTLRGGERRNIIIALLSGNKVNKFTGVIYINLIKKIWIYLLACILTFYLLPLACQYWGSEMFLVLIALPCATLIVSIIYGIRNGFNFVIPIFIGIVFLSTLFIFYNHTAWVYVIVYVVISIIGSWIGSLFYKNRNKV